MADATCTTEQKIPASVSYVTGTGNPAVVDGAPVWASSDEAVFLPQPDASGLSGFFSCEDIGAEISVTITADADMGAGTQEIVLSGTLTGTAPGATGGSLNFGAAVPK